LSSFIGVAGLAVAVGCVAEDAAQIDVFTQPITGGTPTTGDLGVVALLAGGQPLCTGTLISARVVVTAGHCIGPSTEVFFGSAPPTGETIAIAEQIAHPEFDISNLTNDIGLLLLADEAPPAATPWPLVRRPLDQSFVGAPLRLVGFGRTSSTDVEPTQKREGTSVIAEVEEARFRFGPSPSQTCSGDSGGPAFLTIDGQEQLGGVTSSGDPQCAERAFETRVDIHAQTFIAETAENSATLGDDCLYDAQCTTGRCFADETGAFCSITCGDDNDCPDLMFCRGGDGVCEPVPASRVTSGCSATGGDAGWAAALLALFAIAIMPSAARRRRSGRRKQLPVRAARR
jgi:hypothetical protein